MLRKVLALSLLTVALLCRSPGCSAQQINGDEHLDHMLQTNVLTHEGKPFHALLEIAEEHGDPAYQGSVEVFWAAEQRYRIHVRSPQFEQTLLVSGSAVQEQDHGDFYPAWLHL